MEKSIAEIYDSMGLDLLNYEKQFASKEEKPAFGRLPVILGKIQEKYLADARSE